jgi:hypothetical protein
MIQRRRIGSKPSANGEHTGRKANGQFAKGNPGGPGNPHAALVGRNRARLYEIIRTGDIELAVRTMREVMRKGRDSDRLAAARLLLDRALGPIVAVDFEERIAELERRLAAELQRESQLSEPK